MLVLTRKIGGSIIINDEIEVKLLSRNRQTGEIKVGIEAPRDIAIVRKEIVDRYDDNDGKKGKL